MPRVKKHTFGATAAAPARLTAARRPGPPAAVDREYHRLFEAFPAVKPGLIARTDLFTRLAESGIRTDDPRMKTIETVLAGFAPGTTLDFDQFKHLARHHGSLVRKAIEGTMVIPDFPKFQADLTAMFDRVRPNRNGRVATYIPQLGRVNPEYFAVAVCTVDGQRCSLGDARRLFCLQSVSKPITYCLALEEHGESLVHRHVGREPSGRGFNELTLNKEGLPHNPLINSGAIMTCSLVKPGAESADRFEWVSRTWSRLAGGGYVGFNNAVYLSERRTADRNFALGYFMRENGAFPSGTDLLETLELYFQCCSIEMDADALATAAASLAGAGVCPLTGDRVFAARTVQHCLSLMSVCGMYDFSGEFAFSIGLPAKSGVGGAIMLVVPGVMGLCVWSPRLDALGNSVRGIDFCRELVGRYPFHAYDSLTSGENGKCDPRLRRNQLRIEGAVNLCWAAGAGDLDEVQRLAALGVDLAAADYDGRTALHLAAAEGRLEVVEYLIDKGVRLDPVDRWGGTPLTDARRNRHKAVQARLETALSA